MRMVVWCFTLVCACSLLVRGQQGTEGESGSGIRALEHEWTVGQSRNDSHALDLIFDNALIYVEYGKLVTKGEYLSRIRLEIAQPDQIVMGPMTVHTFPGTAIVVGTYSERKTKNGSRDLKHWRFIDTWVYKKGRWMLVSAAAAPLPSR
jgi:hypothetical protein